MSKAKLPFVIGVVFTAFCFLLSDALPLANAQAPVWPSSPGSQSRQPIGPLADPAVDTPWSGGTSSVIDIQAAFNNARNNDPTAPPNLIMPLQAQWNAMSDGQKALWLINQERSVRGIPKMQDLETNVMEVAQAYATYLRQNNVFGHNYDGTPEIRLRRKPAINACMESLGENLWAEWTSASSIDLPVERAVYDWMYDDLACCSWGHRHNILMSYNDNASPAGTEGFLGIGRANGPYMGNNYGEVIVMDTFDPCSTWTYTPYVPPGPPGPIVYNHTVVLPVLLRGVSTSGASSLVNGDFEAGPTGWTESSTNGYGLILSGADLQGMSPHSGKWAAWLGGDNSEESVISQQVTVPSGSPYLSYWHVIGSTDTCGRDEAAVAIDGTIVHRYDLCISQKTGGWVKHVVNLSAYAGRSVSLQIAVNTNSSNISNLYVDDVAFQAPASSAIDPPATLDEGSGDPGPDEAPALPRVAAGQPSE